jgi:hypothetical protein
MLACFDNNKKQKNMNLQMIDQINNLPEGKYRIEDGKIVPY